MKDVTYECRKNDESTGGIVFDYMQNLCLPTIPIQETFYYSKVTANVFAVHTLKDGHATFYIYDETTVKNGSNEVCSFVKDYLLNYILCDPKIKKLHLFRDK